MKKQLIGSVISILVAAQASAGSLMAPYSMDSADTLPKGVRSVRVATFTTEMSNKLDGSGQSISLGAPFSKPVTYNALSGAQPAGFQRGSFQGYLESKGLSLSDVAGQTHGIVDVRLTATVPVVAYGITDNWTVAVAVPVLYSSTNVDTGWEANDSMQSMINQAASEGRAAQLRAAQSKLANVVAAQIASYNYKPVENESHTDLGDITLVSKERLLKGSKVTFALQERIGLPTGRPADPDKLVDVPPGDGFYKAGIAGITDYHLNSNLIFSNSIGYTMQMPTHLAKRIPTTPASQLTADTDSETHVKMGDIFSGSLGVKYTVARLWTLGSAYVFQYKGPDQYGGGLYSQERYNYLSIDTEQTLQTAQAGLTFSTLPMYLTKHFPVPLEASLNYAQILSGRDVNEANIASFEFVMYF